MSPSREYVVNDGDQRQCYFIPEFAILPQVLTAEHLEENPALIGTLIALLRQIKDSALLSNLEKERWWNDCVRLQLTVPHSTPRVDTR